jgi:hypothetical protein
MKLVKNIFEKFLFVSIAFLFLANISLTKSKNPIAVFDKRTPPNDWGRNNIFYLDRHDVACGNQEALQGFRLFRPQGNQLNYKYVCKSRDQSISPNDTYQSNTGWNQTARNKSRSANYLDRHNVQCKAGYALQRFRLGRNGNNINYNFSCVKVDCEAIQTMQTGKSADGGFETIYLDRQDVRVKTNEVLTGFKLNSNGGFWYTVNYCKLRDPVININRAAAPTPNQIPVNQTPVNKPQIAPTSAPKKTSFINSLVNRITTPLKNLVTRPPQSNSNNNSLKTQENFWGNGEIYYLDRHHVNCPPQNVLQGFHLFRPNPTSISYEYFCKTSIGVDETNQYHGHTSPNDVDRNLRNSANYLDRHNVNCRDGFALKSFHLNRPEANRNQIFYKYVCVKVNCSDYKDSITNETSAGDKSIIYLDRQNVKVQENQALVGFRLMTRYQGNETFFKYQIRTCNIIDKINSVNNPINNRVETNKIPVTPPTGKKELKNRNCSCKIIGCCVLYSYCTKECPKEI